MSVASIFQWHGGELVALDDCDMTDTRIGVSDSWFTSDGRTLAPGLHRERFMRNATEAEEFWDAAVAAIPRQGDWFPRVEQHSSGRLIFRLRPAPDRHRTAVLATWAGGDPRTQPTVKGPDLEAMLRVRCSVQPLGATEAVIVSEDGYVVEGAYSALLWWRGDILCGPPAELARVDSVTARSALTLAAALGLDTHEEAVTPSELDGTELWALSALHGIRIATGWVDGPGLAEKPGRLATWRARLDALRSAL
ncbi:MAG: aminotransferase class IV [Salinibacterium sp.]|nr:aminotransferase class IV [Salinibacterium sp.]